MTLRNCKFIELHSIAVYNLWFSDGSNLQQEREDIKINWIKSATTQQKTSIHLFREMFSWKLARIAIISTITIFSWAQLQFLRTLPSNTFFCLHLSFSLSYLRAQEKLIILCHHTISRFFINIKVNSMIANKKGFTREKERERERARENLHHKTERTLRQ